MAVLFEEKRRFLGKETFLILIGLLVATDAFAFLAFGLGWIKHLWEPAILAALTAVGAALGFFLSLTTVVDDENGITVGYFRKRNYARGRVLDAKKGDIDILRDYSGWGHGTKIKYRNYTVPGEDGAVSVKLGGKEVVTVTSLRPDELFDAVMSIRREDRCRPPSTG